jgi:hypothetical protein
MEHLWITILDNPHLDICQPRLKRNMFTLVQDKMEQLSKSPDGSSTGSFFEWRLLLFRGHGLFLVGKPCVLEMLSVCRTGMLDRSAPAAVAIYGGWRD